MTKVLSYIIDQYVNAIISMLKDTSFQTETVGYFWIGEKDSKRILGGSRGRVLGVHLPPLMKMVFSLSVLK